jgi:hypothetical protein
MGIATPPTEDSMSTTGTESGMFNPHRIMIEHAEQRRLPRERADRTPPSRFTVTLGLGDISIPGLALTRVTIEAEGFEAQLLTQKKMIDLMLDLVIETVARERAGIRPGSPTPAGLLAALAAAHLRTEGAPQDPPPGS